MDECVVVAGAVADVLSPERKIRTYIRSRDTNDGEREQSHGNEAI